MRVWATTPLSLSRIALARASISSAVARTAESCQAQRCGDCLRHAHRSQAAAAGQCLRRNLRLMIHSPALSGTAPSCCWARRRRTSTGTCGPTGAAAVAKPSVHLHFGVHRAHRLAASARARAVERVRTSHRHQPQPAIDVIIFGEQTVITLVESWFASLLSSTAVAVSMVSARRATTQPTARPRLHSALQAPQTSQIIMCCTPRAANASSRAASSARSRTWRWEKLTGAA